MKLKKALKKLSRNSIRLYIQGKAPDEIGCTRFGGKPDVPKGFVWPTYKGVAHANDEPRTRPLAFLAQFNCEELSRLDKDSLLPKKGLLLFFYELESMRWGFDPEDEGCSHVYWLQDIASLAPADFPEELPQKYRLPAIAIQANTEVSYPDYIDFDPTYPVYLPVHVENAETYEAALNELDVDYADNRSQLLGWPDIIQNSMETECEIVTRSLFMEDDKNRPVSDGKPDACDSGLERWLLLFQLDAVEQDDFYLMCGDAGRLYFYIRKGDLLAHRFDRVWLILQCC